MQKHTKIYLDFFGYDETDFIPCEISGERAVDIHHIEPRGMGGDPQGRKDIIENLMALSREMHDKYGDKKQYVEWLKQIHQQKMQARLSSR